MGWARKKPHQSIMCVCCISAWFVFQAVGCGRVSSSHQLAARQAPALHLCRVVQAQCMRRHVRINASSQTISPCSETVSRDCRTWLCAVFRHEGVRQRSTVRTCVHLLCGGRKVSLHLRDLSLLSSMILLSSTILGTILGTPCSCPAHTGTQRLQAAVLSCQTEASCQQCGSCCGSWQKPCSCLAAVWLCGLHALWAVDGLHRSAHFFAR